MHDHELRLAEDTPALLPAVLDEIEQTLRELSRGCQAAAGAPPCDERQAQLAAALQDAGAALQTAAESCARARELTWAAMATPEASGAARP